MVIAGWLWRDARAQVGEPIVSGAHRFQKVADGIYYATSSGTMNVGANSPIILTDSEALIINSEITPAAARALVTDLKAITDKPVRYVVDSHYHYDHALGNQVFWPDVQVIGHDNTCKRLLTNVMEQYTYLSSVQPVPARVDGAAAADRAGKGSAAEGHAGATGGQLAGVSRAGQGNQSDAAQSHVRRTMTLLRGGREMQLLYLGRGHTDTDVVVFLPKERIVCTGDLMESSISYMGDCVSR